MKNMIFLFVFAFLFGCSNDETKNKNPLIGTWQLVETIVIDQELNPEWVPVEEGYIYTFYENGKFSSSSFVECSMGNYSLESDILALDYDCEGFTREIETPPGTFIETLKFKSGQIILTPTYLSCIEGCGFKFEKIE